MAKTFKGRLINKHDIEANWKTASNNGFIPLDGELILYDDLNKIKMGDGTTKVTDLPFLFLDEDEIQGLIEDNLETLNYTDIPFTDEYVTSVIQSNGLIQVEKHPIPTAGANTLGIVKGFHKTSGTATGTQTTDATNAPAVNARSTTSGRYYGVETDATGAMYVNVPWSNSDTKVKQIARTSAGEFPILVRGTSAGTGTATGEVTFRALTTLNPSNGIITTNNGSTSTATYGPEEITLTNSSGTVTIGAHDNQLLVSGGINLNITRIQPIIEDEASKGLKVDGNKILTHATGAGNNKKPVYVADAYGTLAECEYTLGAACAKGVTDSTSASAISTGTNLVTERDVYYGLPTINGVHTYNSSTNIYAPTTVGTSGQVLKSNGSGAPVWVDGANLVAPKKITLVATAGQTSFSIPFEYDSLSSNLTVYFNGILMKETDNYTVDTTNNTVNLAGFSAEANDVVTIMGLLGAQSIDFGQEAIDAINQINAAVAEAKEEIDGKVQTAFSQIDEKIDEVSAFVDELPDDVSQLMSKNTNNTLASGCKITLTNVTPSANGDVTTKLYVDNKTSGMATQTYVTNAINTATANIVTDVFKTGSTAPSNTKLLWIDTGTSDPGLKYHNGSSWVTVPVRWS